MTIVVKKDLLPVVPTTHGMVMGSRIFDSHRSWHIPHLQDSNLTRQAQNVWAVPFLPFLGFVVGVLELADGDSIPRVGDGVNQVPFVFERNTAGEVANGVAGQEVTVGGVGVGGGYGLKD